MAQHTLEELQMRQALPLNLKISLTKSRIRGWVNEYGEDGVYVSFSGGKDSTVLLDIVRQTYPNIPAVFVDTGLEYPEIREFVKTFDNVVWLKPKMNFKQVIEKYGYPFISKEVAQTVHDAKIYLTKLIEKENTLTDRQTDRQTVPYYNAIADLTGVDRRKDKNNEALIQLKTGDIPSKDIIAFAENVKDDDLDARTAMLLGKYCKDWNKHKKGIIETEREKSMFNKEKYKFFLNADFSISHLCCNVMKKEPAKRYAKETGRHPMTATMASESRLRTQKWLQNGCNGFNLRHPISNPMSFWTDQDVLEYIKTYNIPICSVYGDIVEDRSGTDEVEGQITISDLAGFEKNTDFDAPKLPLKTTGCKRTGCVFCGFGCHLEKEGEGRFEMLKHTHPQLYDYIMRPKDQGGLNYKQVIDWINEHGDLNIRY